MTPEAPLTPLLSSSEAEAEREAVGHEALHSAEAGSEEEGGRTLCGGGGEASQQHLRTRAAGAGDGRTLHTSNTLLLLAICEYFSLIYRLPTTPTAFSTSLT